MENCSSKVDGSERNPPERESLCGMGSELVTSLKSR